MPDILKKTGKTRDLTLLEKIDHTGVTGSEKAFQEYSSMHFCVILILSMMLFAQVSIIIYYDMIRIYFNFLETFHFIITSVHHGKIPNYNVAKAITI